jgi:hypothetical protein
MNIIVPLRLVDGCKVRQRFQACLPFYERENALKETWVGMLLVVLVCSPLMADDVADEALKYWPQWRGPTWNGVAADADPPVTWSETVGAADRIYLLSEGGSTVVLQRGPQLKVLAINQLDEMFHASPAIVGDAIYLRGDKHLFCFAEASR